MHLIYRAIVGMERSTVQFFLLQEITNIFKALYQECHPDNDMPNLLIKNMSIEFTTPSTNFYEDFYQALTKNVQPKTK